jgi:hypothetical protein
VGVGGALHTGADAFINGARVGVGPGGTENTVLGVGAGAAIASGGNQNVFIGRNCGNSVTSATENTAIGANALSAALGSNQGWNTAVGAGALQFNTGQSNTAIGRLSLQQNLTGESNIGVGRNTLLTNQTGSGNVAIGRDVVVSGGTQISNMVGIGFMALTRNYANDVVAVGAQALFDNTLGTANVAVGRSALNAATTAVATVTTTAAGTGGTDGAKTAIQLERDSGGTMFTYPTVDLTVTGGAVSGTVTVVTGGRSSSTATAGGIIFKANAAGIAAGVPANWRCQLDTAATGSNNTAVGFNAGLLQTTASNNTLVGANAGDAITTATGIIAIGRNACGAVTTGIYNVGVGDEALLSVTVGSQNTAVGFNALRANTSTANTALGSAALQNSSNGISNTAVGRDTLIQNSTGSRNTGIGDQAIRAITGASDNNTALGTEAGWRFGAAGTSNNVLCNNSTFIGYQARPNNTGETNQIAIGHQTVGDGSNTTVLGNSSTTSTRMAGTATSVLRVDGDTVRIANARTPASATAAGNAGDICWDANYIYVCVATNTWKRTAISTWP